MFNTHTHTHTLSHTHTHSHSHTHTHTQTHTQKFPYDYTVEVMNRFNGLDQVHRVPEELCMEVCNIVQKVMTKTIPKKKQ